MPCSYCDTSGHGIDTSPERLESKFADTAAYDADGRRKARLRDGETRDDDNTHAARNAAQLAEADAELREELEARHGADAEDDGPDADLIMEGSDQ